ncbi:MAG TPA: CCA tRNA nucleotidyltransferase [Phycisphaerae bacterium]|nr:CCA tRNA nucleotidyltransferase [Phycisphaerae bacterium]
MKKRLDNPRPATTPHAAAISVVRHLQAAGHVALFAGGCVRDMVMKKQPSDYDVATSAEPREVVRLFRRTQQVGAKFGVVLVRIGRHAIEVATFRRDVNYQDGRHPTAVQFTDAREDAIRRDFTINGMFYDPIKREVVDYVEGRADLKKKVVRAIGDPAQRFAEDHLRLLRAIRFAGRLDFEIDPATWAAIRANAPKIIDISPERIREELDAMLSHPSRARAFRLIVESGLLPHLWPRAKDIAASTLMSRDILAALPAEASFDLALTAILHTLRPFEAGEVCDNLRCSNQTKRTVSWLLAHLTDLDEPKRVTLADLKLLMADPAFPDLLRLLAARLEAAGLPPTAYKKISTRAKRIPPTAVAPPPLVSGTDLMRLGQKPGPLYKKVLDRVYYAQLNGDVKKKSEAMALARRVVDEVKSK